MIFIIRDHIKVELVIQRVDHIEGSDPLKLLDEFLAIPVPGAFHSKLYKRRVWDGKKRFLIKDKYFALGFLPLVIRFAEDNEWSYTVKDERSYIPELRDELTPLIGISDGKEWIARDYQLGMLKKLKKTTIGGYAYPRGIFDAATNAGKTSFAALLINNLKNVENIIFCVSNSTVFDQCYEFFSSILDIPVGRVNSKHLDFQQLTVVMYKSLLSKAKKSLDVENRLAQTTVLIVDECDEAGANTYADLLSMIKAGMRVFMSGTALDAAVVNSMTCIGLSGPVISSVSNQYLIENGYSQLPKVHMYLNYIEYPPKMRSYKDQLALAIYKNTFRCDKILEISEIDDRPVLVTFEKKQEHGFFMYDYLKANSDKVVEIVHGDHKSDYRQDIVTRLQAGEIDILLASRVFFRGINADKIGHLVLAQGGKSDRMVKQILGRGMRNDGEHDHFYVHDFYDFGKHVGKHSRDRIRLYRKEGFKVTEHYKTRRGIPVI